MVRGSALQPRFLHSIFLHPTGEIKAMTADGGRLVLVTSFNMMMARPWPPTPVNIHPIDIWSSFPNGMCNISPCLDRVLTTNGNNLPPRREFYANRIRGGLCSNFILVLLFQVQTYSMHV